MNTATRTDVTRFALILSGQATVVLPAVSANGRHISSPRVGQVTRVSSSINADETETFDLEFHDTGRGEHLLYVFPTADDAQAFFADAIILD